MYPTWSRMKTSRRSLWTAAAALAISFSASAVAHAQSTIMPATACTPVPGVEEPNLGFVTSGTIQNFGQGLLTVLCDIRRPAAGRSVNGTVTIDAIAQGPNPVSPQGGGVP